MGTPACQIKEESARTEEFEKMKKCLLWILVIAMLSIMCAQVYAEQALIPSELVTAINDMMSGLVEELMPELSFREMQWVVDDMSLSFSEAVGTTAYYNNKEGTVEVGAVYESGQADVDAPAQAVALSAYAEVGDDVIHLLRVLVSRLVPTIDESATEAEVLRFLELNVDGELQLTNYTLIQVSNDTYTQFSLVEKNPADQPAGDSSSGEIEDAETPEPTTRPIGHFARESAVEPSPTPTLAITPAPTPTATPSPVPEDQYLISWNGFTAELLRIEPSALYNGDVLLKFYTRFINHSSEELYVSIANATVNGTPVRGIGESDMLPGLDTGADSEEYFFLKPDDSNISAGQIAICNAYTATFTFQLKRSDNYEIVSEKTVTLSLVHVPSFTPVATASPTPKPSYHVLVKGDEGSDVVRLQQRLSELGYLNDKIDGKFGSNTAAAVRDFCIANGLTASDIATSDVQAVLYSSSAKAFEEPYVPLVIKNGSYGEWKKQDGDRISVHVQVTNTSRTKTIKAFEMYMYTEDIWGNEIEENRHYYNTTTKTVKPGETVYCDYMTMRYRSEVSRVYAGIKKVIFSDGTVRENSTVNYAWWDITW